MVTDTYEKIFADVKKVLIVMPHPDDCELYCGGTVARLVADGKEVRVVKVTSGEKGCKQDKIAPAELMKIREKEDTAAMRILGVKDENNVYLRLGDGAVESDLETIGKIVKEIRKFKPDLIITTNPEDMIIRFAKDENWVNHRDHINVAKATIYASYPYARDISFFPEQLAEEGVESHTCTKFLLTDSYNHQDVVLIEMSKFVDQRVNAHASHVSQYNKKKAQESADYFTLNEEYPDGKRYEKFRFVLLD